MLATINSLPTDEFTAETEKMNLWRRAMPKQFNFHKIRAHIIGKI